MHHWLIIYFKNQSRNRKLRFFFWETIKKMYKILMKIWKVTDFVFYHIEYLTKVTTYHHFNSLKLNSKNYIVLLENIWSHASFLAILTRACKCTEALLRLSIKMILDEFRKRMLTIVVSKCAKSWMKTFYIFFHIMK